MKGYTIPMTRTLLGTFRIVCCECNQLIRQNDKMVVATREADEKKVAMHLRCWKVEEE